MKRRIRSFAVCVVAMLIALVTLCGSVAAQPTAGANALHFGISDDESNVTMAPSQLFELLFGTKPLAEETAYLDRLSGISFLYNDAVPDSIVGTHYDAEQGTLQLAVDPYTFVADNGVTVKWIPQSAKLNDQTVVFSLSDDGGYTAVLSGLFHSADFEVQIDFAWSSEVPAASADALLTAPYTAAQSALAILQEHEALYKEWQDKQQAYLTYQAYLQSVAAYEQYLKDMDAYATAVTAYEEYLEILELQRQFDEWKAYWDYQEYLEEKHQARLAYEDYLSKVEKITARLAVLENLFVTDSNGWNLYNSLMGNTVTQVVNRKDELIAAGAEGANVDAAGEATEALRVLMQGYASLRNAEYASDHERITALDAYYIAHYTELRDQFTKLYAALYALHGNSLVTAKLSQEGKLAHYQQFVGELYVTRTALDDGYTRSSDWQIAKKALSAVVEAVNIVPDIDKADPQYAQMPTDEVPAVEAMEPVTEPTYPQPAIQTRPEPAPMEEPVEPTPVQKPADQAPAAAEDPGAAPVAPEQDPTLLALAELLRAGTLPKRTAEGQAKAFTLTTTIDRKVSISNLKTVTFYAADRKTKLQELTLEYGTQFHYEGAIPEKTDAQYIYTFRAWVTADGQDIMEWVAKQDLSLYPKYSTSVRYYDITWVLTDVDGTTKTETKSLAYGATPISPFPTERQPDEQYTYTFSGWDKEVTPVTGNVTYTGSFTRAERLYTVTWVLGDREESAQMTYGADPTYKGSTDRPADDYRYVFVGWDRAFETVKKDVRYTARYDSFALSTAGNGSVLSVKHTDTAVVIDTKTATAPNIRQAAQQAKDSGKALELEWEQVVLTVPNEVLAELLDGGCYKIALNLVKSGRARTEPQPDYAQNGIQYEIAYLDSAGNTVDLSDLSATLKIAADPAGGERSLFLLQDGEWVAIKETQIEVRGGVRLLVCNTYAIHATPGQNYNFSKLPVSAQAGSVVDLNIGCAFGYHISEAHVTMQDGTEIPVTDLYFIMPSGEVTVELTVIKTVYHVTFVADGTVIAEADYFLGDTIVFPPDPEKASDDVYDYIFRGWSSDVKTATGDDLDLVYEAEFIQSDRTVKDPAVSTKNNNRLLTLFLPIFAGVVLVAVVGVLVVVKTGKAKKKETSVSAPAAAPVVKPTPTVASPTPPTAPSAPVTPAEPAAVPSPEKASAPTETEEAAPSEPVSDESASDEGTTVEEAPAPAEQSAPEEELPTAEDHKQS